MPEPRLYLVRRELVTIVYAATEENALAVVAEEEYNDEAHSRTTSASLISSAEDVPPLLMDLVPASDSLNIPDAELDEWYDDPPTVRELLARDGAR
jgi:hypothetical protein